MNDNSIGYQDLIESFEELTTAFRLANDERPIQFELNGQTYLHVPETETFTKPDARVDEYGNPLETLTVLQLMRANFAATCSYKQKITLKDSALPLLFIAPAGRKKVIRAVQLHRKQPPVSAESSAFIPIFELFSNKVYSCWKVRQEYQSSLWAANDPEIAASTVLHYGWTPEFSEKVEGINFYRLTKTPEGIILTLSEPHTLTDRYMAACAKILEKNAEFEVMHAKASYHVLYTAAVAAFYGYQGYYISLPSDMRMIILSKIRTLCINVIESRERKARPLIPDFEEPGPEEFFPVEYDENGTPRQYLMKWEDFIFSTSLVEMQKAKVNLMATLKTQDAFFEKWDAAQLGDGEYTNEQLKEFFAPRLLASAREKNFLILARKEGRTKFWKINQEGAK